MANNELIEQKYKAIARYLNAQSPQKIIDSYVESYAKQLPPKQAELFKDIMLNEFNIENITNGLRPIMAKHFSLEELNALADFYESPHGISAMSKMGPYMADFQPVFNAELMRLLAIWQEKAEKLN